MGNVFDKAIEIALERQAWEEKTNPDQLPLARRGFTEEELAESQRMITAFQKAIEQAAKAGKFKTEAEVEAALEPLRGTPGRSALTRMAETCVPVEPSTMAVAKALAPGRVGSIERIRAGHFGAPETAQEAAKREAQSRAPVREQRAPAPERAPTKEEAAAKTKAQSDAFDAILQAGAQALRMARPGAAKAVENGALSRLPATRMVEGERQEIEAVAAPLPKGQISLFDDAQLPIPDGAAPAKRKRSPKGGR